MKIQIKARITHNDKGFYSVGTDVISPAGLATRCSISTGTNKKLADRLAAAVDAGVAFTELKVLEDVYKEKYVSGTWQVLGRTLNADLRRLGF